MSLINNSFPLSQANLLNAGIRDIEHSFFDIIETKCFLLGKIMFNQDSFLIKQNIGVILLYTYERYKKKYVQR